jgi:ATPases involved in chromosome partitioning
MRAMVWLRVGVGVAVGLGTGGAILAGMPPAYEASASVLVESMGADVNLSTEAELVRSTQTADDAFARLTQDPARPPAVGRLTRVVPVPGTSVLVIAFEAGSPEIAQAGAMAFAEAYLRARGQAAEATRDERIAATEARLEDVRRQLGGLTMLIGQLPPDAADLESLRAGQGALAAEAASLSATLHELRTTPIDPGRIVSPASLPTAPVRPDRRWLGLFAVAGALAGAVVHAGTVRWSRWVRHAADLRRHRSLVVLAELEPADLAAGPSPDATGRSPLGVGPTPGVPASSLTMIFDRLRNEVVAALVPGDHTVLVTAAAPGAAARLVAANLATAFARADNDVVLVGAHGRPPSLAALFDVADIPGLTDVLAGRTTLPRVVQPVARQPRLRVVTPGGWGVGAAGTLLQSEGARSALRALANRIRYVIVDAPSTASGAEAQSLAAAADAVLLVVELGRTRHAQVADAVTQLARVGTRLLGVVTVPRLPDSAEPEPQTVVAFAAAATDAWVGARAEALDGPTAKLTTVPRWPLARERPAARPPSGTPG